VRDYVRDYARRSVRASTRDPWAACRRAAGLVLGVALDTAFGDPTRGHPVAAFGRTAAALERRMWAESRPRGAVFTAVCVAGMAGTGAAMQAASRRAGGRAVAEVAVTALATWAVLGGRSLGREAHAVARLLETGRIDDARARLPHLCGRDPHGLDEKELARAVVESVAENTSDAVVAPLLWGAVAGVPGLLGYRAVNTLDAMVGHRTPRYGRFGWAAAQLDDAANWLPARLTALLVVAGAPLAGGSRAEAWRVLRRDGGRHPSPNAGRCEAAVAGALGVRLGGTNVYAGRVDARPELGEGRAPETRDIRRATRLATGVGLGAAAVAAAVAAAAGRRRR
jgi:adenosylcobinamide-phosphate synthase